LTHHRANGGGTEGPRLLPRTGNDIENLIAIYDPAQVIDHDQAITITIEGESDVRADTWDRKLQQVRRSRPAAVVDVAAVRRTTDGHDLRTQVSQHSRPNLVRSTVGAIHD